MNTDPNEPRHKRLGFWLFDDKVPEGARKAMGSSECLGILEDLCGSKVEVVKRVIRWYAWNKWIHFWFFWQEKIMRRTPDEIEAIIERS